MPSVSASFLLHDGVSPRQHITACEARMIVGFESPSGFRLNQRPLGDLPTPDDPCALITHEVLELRAERGDHVAYTDTDLRGIIVLAGGDLEGVLGYTAPQLLGRHMVALLRPWRGRLSIRAATLVDEIVAGMRQSFNWRGRIRRGDRQMVEVGCTCAGWYEASELVGFSVAYQLFDMTDDVLTG